MEHKILNRYPIGNPRRKWTQDHFVLSQFKAHGNDMRKHIKACADVGLTPLSLAGLRISRRTPPFSFASNSAFASFIRT